MSEKEKNGINGINGIESGRIDLYYPLLFETKYDYKKLCSKIYQCIDREFNAHIYAMQKTVDGMAEEINDRVGTRIFGGLPLKRCIGKKELRRNQGDVGLGRDTKIELEINDQTIKVKFEPGEVDAYNERCAELQQEYERYEIIYGKKFVTYQARIVLLPLYVQLSNDKWVWLNAILYIFANKMGVLKLELPLEEVPITPLTNYNINSYIKGIKVVWGNLSLLQETLEGVCDAYLRKISHLAKITILSLDNQLRNTILVKFDGIPSRVDRIKPEIMQDLYKIIAAPVQDRGGLSVRDIAREYFENHSMGKSGIKYVTSTAGGCLSITDTETIDWMKNKHKANNNGQLLESDDLEVIYKVLTRDMSINVEMALLIPLLKKINESYIYSQKLTRAKDMHGLQTKYKMNVMFISEIQENCYGTVSEQIEAFEQMMPYYLKDKIIRDKMKAVDYILEDKETQKNGLFQNFIAIGGLIMTLVFGLPAIHETLMLIKKICGMASVNIPRISVGGVSMVIWILLIGGLCLFLLLKSKGGKGIEFE